MENHIPELDIIDDVIWSIDYRRCPVLNRDSLAWAKAHMPSKAKGEAAVSVLLDLRGSRQYNIGFLDIVQSHRDFNIHRAAWIIDGRLSGFFARVVGTGSVLSHKVAIFLDRDDALAWLAEQRQA